MKQKGFTLAEVLVTLSIVGIIAAITGPLVSKMSPDVTKITYLKTYDTLKEAIYEIVNNPKYYPEYYELSNGTLCDYSEYPLANISGVSLDEREVSGSGKLANIIGYHMGLDTVEAISDQFNLSYSGKPNFIAKNGVGLFVTTKVQGNSYRTDIYIDVDGPNTGKNCIYSSTCKKPDVFKLSLTASGDLMPVDAVGAKYVKERQKYNKEKIVLDDWQAPEDSVFTTVIPTL